MLFISHLSDWEVPIHQRVTELHSVLTLYASPALTSVVSDFFALPSSECAIFVEVADPAVTESIFAPLWARIRM